MNDFAARLEQARQRLPLKRLMEQHGHRPKGNSWRSMRCPFCQNKDSAGVVEKGGREFFKCFHTDCRTGTKALDEVGFLEHELGLKRREAAIAYLKEAGLWVDAERLPPSVMPGKRGRKIPEPNITPEDLGEQPSETARGNARPTEDLPSPEPGPQPSSADSGPSSQAIETSSSSSLLGAESPTGTDGETAVQGAPPGADSANASPGGNTRPEEPTPGEASNLPISGSPETPATERAVAEDTRATSPDELSQQELRNAAGSFLQYLAKLERRRVCFADAEGAMSFVLAKAVMVFLEEKGAIGPVDDKGWHAVNRYRLEHGANGTDGGGTAPPPPPPPVDPPDDTPPPLKALRWFYTRLHLSDEDRRMLWEKRGLTPDTCFELGYRSNPKSNKQILEEMAQHFPVPVLVESGLWVEGEKATAKPKPNPQFHGMSLVEKRENGKKVKDDDGKPKLEPVWNHPILIPYFDEEGELIHLRPHKGMMKDKPPQLYVVRRSKDARLVARARPGATETEGPRTPTMLVVTEGEFKAAALWQVLGDAAEIASLPGITMAKPLFGDIEEWVEDSGCRRVAVIYDNEEKGDPDLPGYKVHEWKRYDSQVWARYLALMLTRAGYDGRVSVLPNEWRDENGKADWDGYLARIVKDAAGLKMGEPKAVVWERAFGRARTQFLQVIEAARPVNELWQAGFFDSKEERIIKNQLNRIIYEPKLPVGAEAEANNVRRLFRAAAKLKKDPRRASAVFGKDATKVRMFLIGLAQKYQDLRGGYYILKQFKEEKQERWMGYLGAAQDEDDTELKRVCELVLKGIPQRITDFYMRAHYVLNRVNGTRHRLVTLHNLHGVNTDLIPLPSSAFASPQKFREWLLDSITGATWSAGERELNALQEDIAREVAFKDVAEVPIRGFHEDSKCWFFKDVTFLPDGKELQADKNGILWVRTPDGKGGELVRAYKLADTDHERQSFRHFEPRMHPEVKAKEDEIRELFIEMARKMFETIGGYGGWLVIGQVLAFGAGPEIYENFNGFPGLWLHGETQQGKTSVALWLMRVWGFSIKSGVALKDSTKVGLSIVLQQYSNLPVFLEEFQPSAEEWQTEKLKNIFDRVSGSKKTFDEGDRVIRAGAIVTGIATARDAQVKNRYAHVQVASTNRIANHYDWFQAEAHRFFLLGRHVLRNRKAFAELVVGTMRAWMASEAMRGIDERARVVYGAAYAAFVAMTGLLESHEAKDLRAFRTWMVEHATAQVREVAAQVNVNQFWRDLLDAFKSDAFGETPAERRRIFKVIHRPGAPLPPMSDMQVRHGEERGHYKWKSYYLYFQPGPVIDMLRRYKRLQGRDLPLDKNDLRAQMQVRPYWVPPAKTGAVHKQRFQGGRTPESCWCINMDLHELGYQQVSDEEFEESLRNDEGKFLPTMDWIDPRRGDLFSIVDALEGSRGGSEEEEE